MRKEHVIDLDKPIRNTTIEEQRDEFLKERDYESYLAAFDSQHRLRAFLKIKHHLKGKDYWKLLRFAWVSGEGGYPNKDVWVEFFKLEVPGREELMTRKETSVLAALPDKFTVWRGCGDKRGIRGLSWTLDKSLAEFFARRACSERMAITVGSCGKTPLVVEATCKKSDVLAYFNDRSEREIVVDPSRLRGLQTSELLK